MNREDWLETTATVYSCGWEDTPWKMFGGTQYLVGMFSGRYLIVFSYQIAGATYSGEFRSSVELKEGDTFPLRYDPRNPEKNDGGGQSSSLLSNIAA